ncbi:hypothetical protein QYM36_001244, partial [Artemia franciscana]
GKFKIQILTLTANSEKSSMDDTNIGNFFDLLESGREIPERVKRQFLKLALDPDNGDSLCERLNNVAITSGNCAQLLCMLEELSRPASDLRRILDRIEKLIKHFEPTELPAIANQLMILFSKTEPIKTIETLRDYFRNAQKQIESGNCSDKKKQDIFDSRSTIIYHFNKIFHRDSSHLAVRNFLDHLKGNVNIPSQVLDLFILEVSLALSANSLWRDQLIDTLKLLIVRQVYNEQLKQKSAWLSAILPETVDIKSLLSKLTDECFQEKDALLVGMEALGFALLDYQQPKGQKFLTETKVHTLGARLLAKTARKTPEILTSIFSTLANLLVQRTDSDQYVDALAQICLHTEMYISRVHLEEILQVTVRLPVEKGCTIMSSLFPVMRINKDIRDMVLMTMRKYLASRSVIHCQIAVSGLMQMLKFAKDVRTLSTQASLFSQSQSLSSTFIGRHSRCETQSEARAAVFAELFLLFKQCLDAAVYPVKIALYQGFSDISVRNQNLVLGILEILSDHLAKYTRQIGDHLGIRLDDCFDKSGTETVITEPLCYLLQVCAYLAAKPQTSQTISEDIDHLRDNLSKNLDAICNYLADWDLGDWDLTESTNLDASTPLGRSNILKVKFIATLYIPMMEMCILKGALRIRMKAELLLTLYRKYKQLIDFLKEGQEKLKRKDKGKKNKDKSVTPQDDVKTAIEEYEGCHMAVGSLAVILQGIFGKAADSHPAAVDLLRGSESSDFQEYILSIALSLSQYLQKNHRAMKGEQSHGDNLTKAVFTISRSLYLLILRRSVFSDQDLTQRFIAVQSLEAFMLFIKEDRSTKLLDFFLALEGAEEVEDDIEMNEQIHCTIQRLQKFAERLAMSDEDGKGILIKVLIALANLLYIMHDFLPPNSKEVKEIYEWYEKLCKDWEVTDGTAVKCVLHGLIRSQLRSQAHVVVLLTLNKQLHAFFGDTTEEESVTSTGIWGVIKEGAPNVVLCTSVEEIEFILENVNFAIGLLSTAQDDYAESIDKGICARLFFCQSVLQELVQSKIPKGPPTDAVIRGLKKFFISMTSYAKRHKGGISDKLERLVKAVGQKLAPAIYELHIYLDERDKVTSAKRKTASESLAQKGRMMRDVRTMSDLSASMEEAFKEIFKLGKRFK